MLKVAVRTVGTESKLVFVALVRLLVVILDVVIRFRCLRLRRRWIKFFRLESLLLVLGTLVFGLAFGLIDILVISLATMLLTGGLLTLRLNNLFLWIKAIEDGYLLLKQRDTTYIAGGSTVVILEMRNHRVLVIWARTDGWTSISLLVFDYFWKVEGNLFTLVKRFEFSSRRWWYRELVRREYLWVSVHLI